MWEASIGAVPSRWVDKVKVESPRAHEDVARELLAVVGERIEDLKKHVAEIGALL